MTPEQIVEDFTKQRDACVEKIKERRVQELLKNKELYLKLQGAIEASLCTLVTWPEPHLKKRRMP